MGVKDSSKTSSERIRDLSGAKRSKLSVQEDAPFLCLFLLGTRNSLLSIKREVQGAEPIVKDQF